MSSNLSTFNSPIQYIKGVGPKLAKLFATKDLHTLEDLIYFIPRDYQDRSTMKKVSECKPDETALVTGTISSYRFIPMRGRGRMFLEAVLIDEAGDRLMLKWFQFSRKYIEPKLSERPKVIVYGPLKMYGNKLEMVHPDIEWLTDLEEPTEETSPNKPFLGIYSATEGLSQKMIRKVCDQAFDQLYLQITDDLPKSVIEQNKLLDIKTALEFCHHPPKGSSIEDLKAQRTPAHKRLIFEEFFKFEWIVGKRRINVRSEPTRAFESENTEKRLKQIQKNFGHPFTSDQEKAIQHIHEDLKSTKPMNRLLQGDVGCGKTLVSFCSALPVLDLGAQAALLAPTEILVEQHYKNALAVMPKEFKIATLTGSTSKADRVNILNELTSGTIHFVIGTHALLEDDVRFKELGLVIIDEQHRFGVDQRMRLRSKGNHPHILSMTATPIPRTLAMTAYGDLDVTSIKELPKGRAQIKTKLVNTRSIDDAFDVMKTELNSGRQAYIIYPLVEESEKIDLANAVAGAEELANHKLKGFKIGLLHGRMKAQEKNEIMSRFKNNEIQVLVSTTVIEVGVDVPNATVLLIEHAERFGLSQLHQLRGRVGRGKHDSYCFLINHGANEVAFDRLKAMEKTRDGFQLAELDLEIRGPGEFLGTKQSGELQFKYGNLVRDQEILTQARHAAFELLQKDPNLTKKENENFKKYMQKTGNLKQSRLETA